MSRNAFAATFLLGVALVACKGPAGADGEDGVDGEDGKKGNAGEDGADGADGFDGSDGQDGADGADAGIDPALPTLEKALAGIGGEAALTAMTGFTVTSSGVRQMDGEGYAPGDGAIQVSTFDLLVTDEIATASLRYDWARSLDLVGGYPLSYAEIVVDDLGVVNGVDNFFVGPTGDMPSSRWASVGKQHRLLNPHRILLDVIADPTLATEAGVALYDGVLYEILEVADPVAPIDLFVSPSTGRIVKASTSENHHLMRDVMLEAIYLDWQSFDASGVLFPGDVAITLDGELFHAETRSAVAVNPAIPVGTFDFPYGSAPVYDAVSAAFGAASSQFHQSFAGLGLPFDALQTFVAPLEMAPGVWFLGGGSHNSMAVEQDEGVVIVEAPLYPERGDALLAWAATQFPTKPVTHVVVTHHHMDHAAGLRAFVAAGVPIVTSVHNEGLLLEAFRAPSTIWPDALAAAPVNPIVVTVPDNSTYTIADGTNPVTAHHLLSGHASDMLVVHAEGSDHLFNSDLWIPFGYGTGTAIEPVWALELRDFVEATLGTTPVQVGGHGFFDAYAGLDAFVDATFP